MTFYRLVEMILGTLGVVRGGWLIGFQTYHTSPVLEAFRNWHVPESALVAVPALLGLLLILLPTDWRRNVHFLLCPFWDFVTFAIAETNIALTAVPLYATMAILHASSGLLAGRKTG